jgi:hypothetical protein
MYALPSTFAFPESETSVSSRPTSAALKCKHASASVGWRGGGFAQDATPTSPLDELSFDESALKELATLLEDDADERSVADFAHPAKTSGMRPKRKTVFICEPPLSISRLRPNLASALAILI